MIFMRPLLGLLAIGALSAGAAHAAQPATPSGVFAFVSATAAMPDGVYSNPSVTGITLTASWADLEPKQGQYAWSSLDSQVALAVRNGRQVALRVEPGAYSPSWVYTAGAAKFSLRWYLGGALANCSMASLPLPWDSVYLTQWTRFVAALGARYAANPAVTLVKMDGINSVTGETLLVYSAGTHSPGAGVCGAAPIAPVSAWKSAGYLPGKVTDAWRRIVASYVASFPTQQLAMETGSWGFPPIDASGQIIAGSDGDRLEVQTLDQIGAQLAGSRFVLQNDGLSTGYTYPRPAAVPATTPLAYQPVTRVSTDTACQSNGGVSPCNPTTTLSQMMANAHAAGAEYVEMFVVDLQNPALTAPLTSFSQASVTQNK